MLLETFLGASPALLLVTVRLVEYGVGLVGYGDGLVEDGDGLETELRVG
jgi:hypothetical protein